MSVIQTHLLPPSLVFADVEINDLPLHMHHGTEGRRLVNPQSTRFEITENADVGIDDFIVDPTMHYLRGIRDG